MSGVAEIFGEERDEQLENASALLSTHYLDAQLDKFVMEGWKLYGTWNGILCVNCTGSHFLTL